jgi:FKBP-type peptidyl-prolyl cis-trans isomerase FklB
MLMSCGSKSASKTSSKTEIDSISLPGGYTDTDSISFLIGYNTGKQIANSGIDGFNVKAMSKGMQSAIDKKVIKMSDQDMNTFFQKYFTGLETKVSEKNLREGQAFLEENKKKQGVVTLTSGLQYKIIKEGAGIKPAKEDQVKVVYHGTLIDGTVFDSSKERGDTATFPVGGVVPGFTEALTLMNEGSVWEVYIPSELGYGSVNRGGPIKPNSVLVFEINLAKVEKQEAPAMPAPDGTGK